jgi:hypothetical protein
VPRREVWNFRTKQLKFALFRKLEQGAKSEAQVLGDRELGC